MRIFTNVKPQLLILEYLVAYVMQPNLSKLIKFSPRAAVCVMMGYSTTQKGYLLFDLIDKKMIVSRDVVFHENVFPFRNKVLKDSLPHLPLHTYLRNLIKHFHFLILILPLKILS